MNGRVRYRRVPGYPYNAPAITLQVGINMAATLADASLTQMTGAAAGTKVATCAYDFQKYTNPDGAPRRTAARCCEDSAKW